MPRKGFRHAESSLARMTAFQRGRHAPLEERFFANIEYDTNGGCWLWSGAMPQGVGYGTIQKDGRTLGAHRVSYELHRGEIPRGLYVLHKCDVRACVNPSHLYAGTQKENERDKIVRGRRRLRVGDQCRGSKLREADIPGIRRRLLMGHSCKAIAADYGVTDCAINALRRGRTWWHVPGIAPDFNDGEAEGPANNRPAEAAA